jgi:hypothetical protein
VSKGRKDLNFSEWESLSVEKMNKMKAEIAEEISDDKMPLPIYVFIHSEALLSDDQKLIIKNWTGNDADPK